MTATVEGVALTRARELYRQARAMKETDFAESGEDSGVPLLLVPWRGADTVAHVFLNGERSNVLAALRAVAGGFNPDAIGLVIEAWQVIGEPGDDSVAINPDTGKPWDARNYDMEAYVKRHGRNGLVRESITAHVLTAGGDLAVCSGTFVVDGTSLRWDEPKAEQYDEDDPESTAKATGALPDLMRNAVRAAGRTSVFRSMAGDRFGVSPEAVLAATDALAAQSLEGSGVVGAVMLSARDDEVERREVIARVTGRPWSSSMEGALDDEQRRTGWGS